MTERQCSHYTYVYDEWTQCLEKEGSMLGGDKACLKLVLAVLPNSANSPPESSSCHVYYLKVYKTNLWISCGLS